MPVSEEALVPCGRGRICELGSAFSGIRAGSQHCCCQNGQARGGHRASVGKQPRLVPLLLLFLSSSSLMLLPWEHHRREAVCLIPPILQDADRETHGPHSPQGQSCPQRPLDPGKHRTGGSWNICRVNKKSLLTAGQGMG